MHQQSRPHGRHRDKGDTLALQRTAALWPVAHVSPHTCVCVVCVCVCLYTSTHRHTHSLTHSHTHSHSHTLTHTSLSLSLSLYIYIYIYIYIYMVFLSSSQPLVRAVLHSDVCGAETNGAGAWVSCPQVHPARVVLMRAVAASQTCTSLPA